MQTAEFIIQNVILPLLTLLTFIQQAIPQMHREKKVLTYKVLLAERTTKIDPKIAEFRLPTSANYDPYIIVLQLLNSGTASVPSIELHETPIIFVFETKINHWSVVDADPSYHQGAYQKLIGRDMREEKALLITPRVLDSGQWIKFAVTLSQFTGSIKAHCHFSGFKIISLDEFDEERKKRQARWQKWSEWTLLTLCLAIFGVILFSSLVYHNVSPFTTGVLLLITVAFLWEFFVKNVPVIRRRIRPSVTNKKHP